VIVKSRKLQLLIVFLAALAISAPISHGLIGWLKIRAVFGAHWTYGKESGKPTVYVAGSSLALGGFSWKRLSTMLDRKIEGWQTPGSSPSEWEHFQPRAASVALSIIVVSTYDLNEHFLCDFRADVVPLKLTLADLWQSRMDWTSSKRILGMYPLTYVRKLFPTTGRSDGVMVGVREKLEGLVHGYSTVGRELGPTVEPTENREKLSNWSRGRILRRLENMGRASQGKHGFTGPKSLALSRMLRHARDSGVTVAVVLPVSPSYAAEFLSPEVRQEFERALSQAAQREPSVHWVRVDLMNELRSDEYFFDLVHLNLYGQEIATEALLRHLRRLSAEL
jgi:hypothetical protein